MGYLLGNYMTIEIPQYGLKAYAVLFAKHGVKESFKQSELDWIVSSSMKKKIFSLLVKRGWIKKNTGSTYVCTNPAQAIIGLLDFRVPEIIKHAEKEYAFTQLSAIEIWSDFVYVQRGKEKSPYFIKILKKDIPYWKSFFNQNEIPHYMNAGTTIGEYVILIPTKKIHAEEREGINVEPLKETIKYAKSNEIYAYATQHIIKKYGGE